MSEMTVELSEKVIRGQPNLYVEVKAAKLI